MWARAVWWEGEKEVEDVIPLCWVIKGQVYWPPKNQRKHLFNMSRPLTSWTPYELLKIKYQSGNITNVINIFWNQLKLSKQLLYLNLSL